MAKSESRTFGKRLFVMECHGLFLRQRCKADSLPFGELASRLREGRHGEEFLRSADSSGPQVDGGRAPIQGGSGRF